MTFEVFDPEFQKFLCMFRPTPQWKPRRSAQFAVAPSQCAKPSPRQPAAVMADRDHDNFDEVADIARRSYKLVKEVMGELNVEYKLMEGSALNFQPDDLGTTGNCMVLVNSCAQGVTDVSRTGDRIKISNFFISGQILRNSTVDAYLVRCIVFWQPQASSVSGQGVDLVFPTSTATSDGLLDYAYKGTILATAAPKDYDSQFKTEILWDKVWAVNPSTSDNQLHHFKKLIKLNRHVQYENDSGVISSGVLRVAFLSNAAAATTGRPAVNYLYRTYFIDN